MKKYNIKLMLVVSVLVFAILACSLPQVSLFSTPDSQTDQETEEAVRGTEEPADEGNRNTDESPPTSIVVPDEVLLQDALIQLYETVSPGVVSIQVFAQNGSGLGSGFVIDEEGHVVTNYHVVDGAEEVEVHFPSGLKTFGDVIGEDLDSDLALIRVDVDSEELYPLPLGDSNQLRVGQSVVAIGNPFGLSGTMTTGIISARGRTLESIRQTDAGQFFSAGDLIQTDATINPGNSGGPLLNLNGEVIGINRAIATGGQQIGGGTNTGIGFAVSSNILKLVLPSLKDGETYNYPYLGLSALPSLSLSQAEFLGLSRATGAYVVDVVYGGPADEAGILAGDEPTQFQGLPAGGDLIIGVDGREVLQFSDMLSYMILNKQPGEEMEVTVLRDGEELTLTITLGSRSETGQ
ncbi:MAG: S1C family serine protease [Brevefilum sp.]